MRLKVTLWLLLGAFPWEFCWAENEACDIEIEDYNTYTITCPSLKRNESITEVDKNEPESLCCRLWKTEYQEVQSPDGARTEVYPHEKFAFGTEQADCKLDKNVTGDKHFNMIVNGSIEEQDGVRACRVVLTSTISEAEGKTDWFIQVRRPENIGRNGTSPKTYDFHVLPQKCTPIQTLEQQGYLEGYAPSDNDKAKHDLEKGSSDSFLDYKKKCENDVNCYYFATTEKGGVATYTKDHLTHFCQSKDSLVVQKGNSAYFDECKMDFQSQGCSMPNTWIPSVAYSHANNKSECAAKCSTKTGFYSWNEGLKKCGILDQKNGSAGTFCQLSGYVTYSKNCETQKCQTKQGK